MAVDKLSGICLDGPKIWEHITAPNDTFQAYVPHEHTVRDSLSSSTRPLSYEVIQYRHFLYTGVGFWTCNQQIRFVPVAPWTTNAMPAFNAIRDHFPHIEKLARLITDLRMYRMTTPECIDKVVGLHPELSPMKDMAIELGVYEEGNGG